MKNLIYYLFLPILVLAQPITQFENEFTDTEFSIDLYETSALAFNDGIQLSADTKTFKRPKKSVALKPSNFEFSGFKSMVETPPEYLSTLSLIATYSTKTQRSKPQERLNRLLASYDIRFPKEHTLVNWLKPVRYTTKQSGGVENMPQGFGPLIRI